MGRRHILLRAATAAAHEELELATGDLGFFADAAGYADYLERVGPFYARVETALDHGGMIEAVPDWPLRRKARLIRSDLDRLGRGAAAAVDGPGWGADGLDVGAPGARLGVLYVLEGATLGGAVLRRRLLAAGVPADALSLLASYGPERGRMWRAFLDAVESAPLSGRDEALMVNSAVRTFATFRRILVDTPRDSLSAFDGASRSAPRDLKGMRI